MEKIIERYAEAAKNQKVTVFMLSSNREAYIGSAVQAVLEQTYRDFQLVILDNNSTDRTKAIIDGFQDERIFFIQRESALDDPNYRFAFQICVTKYLVVLHDDDVVCPNYLETVLKCIEKENCSSASVGACIIDEHGSRTGRLFSHSRNTLYRGSQYFENFFSSSPQGIVFPSAIYDRAFYRDIEKIHDSSAGPAVDQYVWFQTERFGGSIYALAEQHIQYRVHSGQDSNRNAGFMDLMLIDALMKDEYYLELLRRMRRQIVKRIWMRFGLITKKYHAGLLDKKRYHDFFGYDCIGFMKETFGGRLYYWLMQVLYQCSWLTGCLVKMLQLRAR